MPVRNGGACRRLPTHPSSVAQARRLVREELTSSGRDDLVETAELLVSEVVTNALVHTGTPVDVAASVEPNGLRVEVTDGSPHLPFPRHYTEMASTGRGLRLLQKLADQWGVDVGSDGKTVWFEVSTDNAATEGGWSAIDDELPTQSPPLDEQRQADGTEVVLRNVPLLLHAAWREHAETLLREHLLVRLEEDDAGHSLEDHAAAQDAMALLCEQIPRPEIGQEPREVMAAATEPGVSSERLTMWVPMRSVANFDRLDEVLDEALAMVAAGTFLTPPMQPELAALRRWLCRQVREQSRGGTPTPWSMPGDAGPPSAGMPLSWDPREVTEADHAVVGADDTDQIVAVSRSAADLLGYRRPEELVGRRLLAIIPARYRQAHLAGFTLHLLMGRRPLLERPLVVPALRADGSEITTELLVRARSTPEGRRLFVAELRAVR